MYRTLSATTNPTLKNRLLAGMKGKIRNKTPTRISLLSCEGNKQATSKIGFLFLITASVEQAIYWKCAFVTVAGQKLETTAFKRQIIEQSFGFHVKSGKGFVWSEQQAHAEQFWVLLPGVRGCSVRRVWPSPGPAARWPRCANRPGTPPGECSPPASRSTARPGRAATRHWRTAGKNMSES